MSATPRDILVIGATGAIGEFIISELIKAASSFGRLGIFTSPSTADKKAGDIAALKGQGVQVYIGDITKEQDVRAAYVRYDTIISAVGRPIIDFQIQLLKWAEETENVKRFYPSEFGTDIEYGPQSKDEKPHQLKLKVRKFIREDIRRIDVVYIVTGPFADMYVATRGNDEAGGFNVKEQKAVLLGTGDEKISLTTMVDVGRLTVGSLIHYEAARNQVLKVNSYTTTPNEILCEFEKQTGGDKWAVQYTSLDQLKRREDKEWAAGNPAATGYTLKRIWTEGGTLYEKSDNEIIGPVNTQTLEDTVRLAIARQLKTPT